MSTSLLRTRRFAPLFWTQFFSAFNDNFLKNTLVFLILFGVGGVAPSGNEALVTLAAAIFIAPFFFLSGLGGQIADRFDKALVAQHLKRVEIGVAALAVLGFVLHSLAVLFVALFLFGVIAALFGPIKYGILPDHLAREELPAGNALIEGATFMAILLGTIAGGLAAKGESGSLVFGVMIMAFAVLCWLASRYIPPTGEADTSIVIDKNIARSTLSLLAHLRADKRLWWGGLVVSWFWLVGAVALSLMPPLVKSTLGASEEVVTAFLAIFSISIAIGSGLASWLSAGRVVLLPTVIGGVLLGVFALDLGYATYGVAATAQASVGEVFSSARGIRIAIDLAGLAIAGGLFIVPSFAAVQTWAGADRRARTIAAVNVLNAAFMVAGTGVVAALQAGGVKLPMLFVILGAANLGVAIWIGMTMPKIGAA